MRKTQETMNLESMPRYMFDAVKSILDIREKELLDLKGPCSTDSCILHYAHSGPCNVRLTS